MSKIIEEISDTPRVEKPKIGKIVFYFLIFFIIVGGFGLAVRYFYWLRPIPTTILVLDEENKAIIDNAKLSFGPTTTITNKNGQAVIDLSPNQPTAITISKSGYQTQSMTITPKRNASPSTLLLKPETSIVATVTGKITDPFNQPIQGAKVKVSRGEAIADKEGTYKIENIKTDTYQATVEKEGYNSITLSVTFTKDHLTWDSQLTPTGRVVFTSNRDGKRGLYTANFDGSDQKSLVNRVEETEDFNPTLSPHDRLVAFLSTRDKRKDKYGTDLPNLYLVKMDGSELKKIGEPSQYSGNIMWYPDGQQLAWLSTKDHNTSSSKNLINILNFASNETTTLEFKGSLINFDVSPDSKKLAYSVNSWPAGGDEGLYIAGPHGESPKKITNRESYSFGFSDDGEAIMYSETQTDGSNHTIKYTLSNNTYKDVDRDLLDHLANSAISLTRKERAIIENRDGKSDVFISDLDGKNERKITDLGTAANFVRWSQNGDYLIFGSSKSDETAYYLISRNDGKAKKIVDALLSSNQNYYGY